MPRFEKLNPNKEGYGEADIASKQAVYQLLALVVTILIALVGGAVTGMIMRMIAQFERLDEHHRPNQTILKLALSVGNLTGKALGVRGNIMPEEAYFDDHLFFEVHEVILGSCLRQPRVLPYVKPTHELTFSNKMIKIV